MQFDEMMKNSPTIKQFYFEWEGLRVFGAIDITDVPKELEVKFTSLHPAGDVALRMNAFGCKFAHVDGKLSDRIRPWFTVMSIQISNQVTRTMLVSLFMA